jgi:hypothetical protein
MPARSGPSISFGGPKTAVRPLVCRNPKKNWVRYMVQTPRQTAYEAIFGVQIGATRALNRLARALRLMANYSICRMFAVQ